MALLDLAQVAEMRRRERVEHEYARMVGDSQLRTAVGEEVLTALCERYEELGGDLEQLAQYDAPREAGVVLQYPRALRVSTRWDRVPGESIQQYNARACMALWLSKGTAGEISQEVWDAITPHLLEHNTGFLRTFAEKYAGNVQGPFEDYFQACRVGMLEALHRYDPTKGYKLMTYALHWLKNECEHLRKSSRNGVYIPKNQQMMNSRILRGDDAEAKSRAKAETDMLFATSLDDVAQHRGLRPRTHLELIAERESTRDAEFAAVAKALRKAFVEKALAFRITLSGNQDHVLLHRVVLPPYAFELLVRDGEETIAGFRTASESLEEVAAHMPNTPVTRENARQIEKRVMRRAQERGFPIRVHGLHKTYSVEPNEVDIAAIYEQMR